MSNSANDETYPLNDEDYLKLYMYFEDRADNIKEAMFKTLTWTVGFAAALLGLIFANLINYDRQKAVVPLCSLVIVFSIAGLVICLYSYFMLHESGSHIQRNWNRANTFKKKIANLDALLQADNQGDSGTTGFMKRVREWWSKIWNQLKIIVFLFAVAFAGTFIWSIVYWP